MRPNQLAAWALFIFISAYTIICLAYYAPPKVVSKDAPASSFSAERAMPYLKEIAKEPHSKGTPELLEVEQYLTNELSKRGLEVSVQDTVAWRNWGYNNRMSRVRNILAFMPGTNPTTTIIVAAHYDSQPNTLGAADDGAACAAMLETIDAIKADKPLKNNILFLITDNEEFGLLGAEAFVEYYPNLDDIGLIINWEARGNSGPSLTFEISPDNGWLMREYAKGAAYPIANSMTYEIYKLLPNDTDYTMFREKEVPGINNAFIKGHVYYHSMADSPENISQASFQHHGSNMLSMTRHFGNLDWPTETKAPDVVFFNPIGSWLVLYPANYDPFLMSLTGVLLLLLILIGHRSKRFSIKSVLIGAGIFILTLTLSLALVYALNFLVKAMYPQYAVFYYYSFYNVSWYLLAYVGVTLACCGAFYQWALGKWNGLSLGLGAAILVIFFMIGMSIFLPTGAFMMYVPLIGFLIGQYIIVLGNIKADKQPYRYALIQAISLLPAIGLWSMLAVATFTAFSLAIPFGPVLAVCLLIGLSLPSLYLIKEANSRLLGIIGVAALFIGFVAAHFQSSPSPDRPLQTSLFYQQHPDGQSFWVSAQDRLDDWNGQYFKEVSEETANTFYPTWNSNFWQSPAAQHQVPAVDTTIVVDSLRADGQRDLVIKLSSPEMITSLRLFLDHPSNILEFSLDGRPIKWTRGRQEKPLSIYFMGPKPEGLTLKLLLANNDTVPLSVISRTWGIPEEWLVHPLPEEFIFGTGGLSNSVMVRKDYQF